MTDDLKKFLKLQKYIFEHSGSVLTSLMLQQGQERDIDENLKILEKMKGRPLTDDEVESFEEFYRSTHEKH